MAARPTSTSSWASGQSFEIGGIVSGKVDRDRRRPGRRRRRLQVRRPRPAERVGRRAAAASRATTSRSCSRAWKTRPARSSSRARRRTGCAPGRWSSPSTTRATSSRARSPARSRAACSSTSACNVFLPASQVDIRRPSDIADYIDQDIECMILKIDEEPAQHRRQPPQAHRDHARAAEEAAPRGDRGRPGPQGHGQEHRRLRRVRRPRRHRRPAAHHRHELGPDQPPQRHGQDRRPDRGHGPARRQGPREDRAGPQAEDRQPVGERRRQVPGRHPRHAARSSTS